MRSDLTGSHFKHCLNRPNSCLVAIDVVLHINDISSVVGLAVPRCAADAGGAV